MNLSGRRESSNVEDRRGMSTVAKAGVGGIAGIIIIALMTFMQGGNIGDVVTNVVQQGGLSAIQEEQVEGQRECRIRIKRQHCSGSPCIHAGRIFPGPCFGRNQRSRCIFLDN